ncbi:hypothetical protein SAMN03080618_00851 [Aquamicrobium aerolatum DSM 21857]|uniref:Uncharacterized protein n=1 Tax=Aquamicrobium aerolatum DSM 21857 TaxID=1121003 RepID=A0A1I3JGS8_9HYPH|nr:hypothetical protein SAMN03080618_00851 [Aquamicrobium aerolatum DSM 21857]
MMFTAMAAITWLAVTIWGAYFVYNVMGIVTELKRSEIIFVSKVGRGAEVSMWNQTAVDGGVTFTARPGLPESSKSDMSVLGSTPR